MARASSCSRLSRGMAPICRKYRPRASSGPLASSSITSAAGAASSSSASSSTGSSSAGGNSSWLGTSSQEISVRRSLPAASAGKAKAGARVGSSTNPLWARFVVRLMSSVLLLVGVLAGVRGKNSTTAASPHTEVRGSGKPCQEDGCRTSLQSKTGLHPEGAGGRDHPAAHEDRSVPLFRFRQRQAHPEEANAASWDAGQARKSAPLYYNSTQPYQGGAGENVRISEDKRDAHTAWVGGTMGKLIDCSPHGH